MSDEPQDPDNVIDQSRQRRQQAEGAAADLSRMGIDPRSLGLGSPAPAASPTPQPSADGGSVVPLRPEFREQAEPAPVPAEPQQRTPAPAAPAAPAPPARPDHARMLRSVLSGLARPDAAEAIQGERALVDAVRQRQSDRRVVAFVSGKGGVGCTSAALATGLTFMALRDDSSVVVDVQQGTASLGALAGVEAPDNVHHILDQREAVEPPRSAAGLGIVDGVGWNQGLDRNEVGGLLERLGREHVFNLLDVGDDAGSGGHAALARADQVVAVTGPGLVGAAALTSVLERVRMVNPAVADSVVTVVVCLDSESHQQTLKEVGQVAERESIVVVGPEPRLRSGSPYDAAAVAPATREAFVRVAAAIAGRARR